jgi:hypothetical protein
LVFFSFFDNLGVVLFYFIAGELVNFKKKKKDSSFLTIFIVTAIDLRVTSVEPARLNIYCKLIIEMCLLVYQDYNVSFYLLVCQSCDAHKEQLTSSRENGKILSNQTVSFASNQSPAPGAKFVSHKEQVALDSRINEMAVDQALKIQGYLQSDREIVEKLNCHTRKKIFSHDNEARQVTKYHQDVCLNKNFLQKRCDTDMECTRAPSEMIQMLKHQSFNNGNTSLCARSSLSKNLPIKQSFSTRKEQEIFDLPTKQRICEPLKLENRRSGWDCSKQIPAGKQNYNNHKEPWPIVGGLGDINSQDKPPVSKNSQSYFPVADGQPLETIVFGTLGPFALKSIRATNTQTASKAFTFAAPLVLQRSRAATTENR